VYSPDELNQVNDQVSMAFEPDEDI